MYPSTVLYGDDDYDQQQQQSLAYQPILTPIKVDASHISFINPNDINEFNHRGP
jgi:hypothetical protein